MMASSSVEAVLIEIARRGVQLRGDGGRLGYRPRSALTPDLAEQLKAHKAELLALLRAADGVVINEHRVAVATLIRQARRARDLDLSIALRDAWRERLAICEIDGGVRIEHAEEIALEELQKIVARGQVSAYNDVRDGRSCRTNSKGDRDEREDQIPHCQGVGRRTESAIAADEWGAGPEC